MTPQLFSIEHTPLHLPYWRTLMDDLCNPSAATVARALGIGERTVQRYNATGHAPRVVCLAVFWVTRWGRSSVNAQATNDACLMANYVRSMHAHANALSSQVEHLLSIGNFGSANDPSHQPLTDQRRLSHDLAPQPEPGEEPTPRAEQLPALMAHVSRLHQASPGHPETDQRDAEQ